MDTIAVIVWGAALVIFTLVEAATVGLVAIWFMAGALAALFTALLGGAVWLQVVLFLAVSLALLGLFRPWLQKYIRPKIVKTNADSLLGKLAVVTEPIDNLEAVGCVKVNGVLWSARSADGSRIPAAARVVVREIEGAKLIVSPAEKTVAV